MHPPNEAELQELATELLGDAAYKHASNPIFSAYFKHYDSIFSPSVFGDAVAEIESPVLKTHKNVLSCVQILKSKPTSTLNEFSDEAFKNCDAKDAEKEYATRAVVSAAFMINCASKDHYSEGFQSDSAMRVKWEANQEFSRFVEQAFTSELSQNPNSDAQNKAITQKDSLKAWKLVKRSKIKIRPTNNLIEHLLYDPKDRILRVFHQTMFLQTQLKRWKGVEFDLNFEHSLRLGILPPRLLFETLVSIHCILFPVANIGNKRSMKLLKKLIRKHGFDAEATWVEFVRPIPDDFAFKYWGSRLAELYEVVKRPPPTNSLISWFERHTSERNALTVAIIGLFLSVLLGLLSLVVGILQLIVAWLAWKEAES
ncbi:Fc.00g048590.m01.CDS01 [Cosmosporella sp. VM-42]